VAAGEKQHQSVQARAACIYCKGTIKACSAVPQPSVSVNKQQLPACLLTGLWSPIKQK
jgi:hypothetical protein